MRNKYLLAVLIVMLLAAACNSKLSVKVTPRADLASSPLAIESPLNDAVVTQAQLYISGTCPVSTVAIESEAGPVFDGNCLDGSFIVGPVTIKLGPQTFTVKAVGETTTFANVTVTGGTSAKLLQLTDNAPVTTNKLEQSISGICTKELLQLTFAAPIEGSFHNECEKSGAFRASFKLTQEGNHSVTLQAKSQLGANEQVSRIYIVDRTPPSVAVTSPVPATNGIYTTDDLNISIAGTCSTDTDRLTATPWAVTDDDCSDGSFAVAATSVAVALYPVVNRRLSLPG